MQACNTNDRASEQERAARHGRAVAITSVPAVAENMVRYALAMQFLLTGRTTADRLGDEPAVMSVLTPTDAEHQMMLGLTSVLNIDHVILCFDSDRPAGPPVRVDVVRIVGDTIVTDFACGVWSPAGGGRAVLTSRSETEPRYFTVAPRKALAVHAGMPSISIFAGCDRAGARLHRLAKSKTVGAGLGRATRNVFTGAGSGKLLVETQYLTA